MMLHLIALTFKRLIRGQVKGRSARPSRRIWLETLEDRTVPAIVNWIATGSGNWVDPANWSTGHLPGINDDVVVANSGVTVKFNGNAGIKSLSMAGTLSLESGFLNIHSTSSIYDLDLQGGALNTYAGLTISGSFDWTGGKLTGIGSVANLGTLYLSGTNDKKIDKLTLSNYGTMVWTGGDIQASNSGKFSNLAGGTFNVLTSDRFDPPVTNSGTTNVETTGTVEFGTFTNQGTLNLMHGTMQADSFAQTTGKTQLALAVLASSSTLYFKGGYLVGGGTVSGNLVNVGAEIEPGAGETLTIQGNYGQTQTGYLTIDLGGTPSSATMAHLSITDSAYLDGYLDVATAMHWTPGDYHEFLFANSVIGTFAEVETSSISGVNFTPNYTAKTVSLVAMALAAPVPVPVPVPVETTPPPAPLVTTSEDTESTRVYPEYVNTNPIATVAPTVVKDEAKPAKTTTLSSSGTTSGGTSTSSTSSAPITTGYHVEGTDLVLPQQLSSSIGFGPNSGIARAATSETTDNGTARTGSATPIVSYFDKAPAGRTSESSGENDDLLASFTLALPELELPSETDLLAALDLGSILSIGGQARAGIVQQGGSSVSVVATLVGDDSPSLTDQPIQADALRLADLLFMPLHLGDSSGLDSSPNSLTETEVPEKTALARQAIRRGSLASRFELIGYTVILGSVIGVLALQGRDNARRRMELPLGSS